MNKIKTAFPNNILLNIALLSMLSACGGSSANQNGLTSKSFFYVNGIFQYSLNDTTTGCSTGPHQLESLAQLCAALESNSFNNNCALASRETAFSEAECPGTFQQGN